MTKILVAEDDANIVELIREILQEDGYHVTTVGSGTEALAVVRTVDPDLVLLDFMLPGKDGYEVLLELQQDEGLQRIPVIMITSQDGILYPQISVAIGAVHHLQKPFRSGELLEVVERALEGGRSQ
ncbi:MAG: response regulator [Candidatus Schekmanbacteria bacterium]|nr:response regulator [Candidatus Schekmanbacteria bacterium]